MYSPLPYATAGLLAVFISGCRLGGGTEGEPGGLQKNEILTASGGFVDSDAVESKVNQKQWRTQREEANARQQEPR